MEIESPSCFFLQARLRYARWPSGSILSDYAVAERSLASEKCVEEKQKQTVRRGRSRGRFVCSCSLPNNSQSGELNQVEPFLCHVSTNLMYQITQSAQSAAPPSSNCCAGLLRSIVQNAFFRLLHSIAENAPFRVG